jgi:hypothetical protein
MSETSQPGSLAAALIQLQSRLPRITKDDEAQVGTRSYRYANLASIHDAVFPLLADCGLYWTCVPTMTDGAFTLDYALTHLSGESIGGHYPLGTSGTPQQVGSAITYARRYTLTAVLGIAPAEDDDDGQQAETASKGSDWLPPANPRYRKATRHRADPLGPPDDEWTVRPHDEAGSSTGDQHQQMGRLFGKLGITERSDRLAVSMSTLNLPELGSSKELSYSDAETLIAALKELEAEQEAGA